MKKHLTCFLMILTIILCGAEIKMTSGRFDVTFNDRGATITVLTFEGKQYVMTGMPSFADQLLQNEGADRQIIESFDKLRFRRIRQDAQHIVFEAVGVGAFDWLKLTKHYFFPQNSNAFSVEYTLGNMDAKPHRAGIRTKTFLRRCGIGGLLGNSVWQPREGRAIKLDHPGPAGTDEWSLNPAADWCAVALREDGSGAVVRITSGRTTALYSWFLNESTLEWFLSEVPVPPGGSDRFTVNVECSGNVPAEVEKLAAEPLAPRVGAKTLLPEHYAGLANVDVLEPGSGSLPRNGKFMDVTVKKQFSPSIRSVILPDGVDPELVSVFPLENGSPRMDLEVPFLVSQRPDGGFHLLFQVPAVDPRGRLFNTIRDGEMWGIHDGKFSGYVDFSVRIALDIKFLRRFDPGLFAGGADLVYNGSFEEADAVGPLGFWLLREHKYREYWTLENTGGRNNSRHLRMEITNPKFLGGLGAEIILEPGRKYVASAWVSAENPNACWTIANIEFADANGNELQSERKRFESRETYGWRKVEHTFYAPENAVTAVFRFAILAPRVIFRVDDVKIVPEEIDVKPRSAVDALRDRLLAGHYAPLEVLERIDHSTVTPHTRWFFPAAESLPELLFLCPPGDRQDDTTRRAIVEFSQRMTLKYRYIPLLQKIQQVHPCYGVMPPVFAPFLEEYTMQLLRESAPPRLVLVCGVDFKSQVQPEFVALLEKWQQDNSGMLLMNCRNVPPQLLGERLALPPEFFQVPEMRKLPREADGAVLRLYRNGNARVAEYTCASDRYYLNAGKFRSLPEGVQSMHPSYVSRDFPFWEYLYLPGLKALRYACGIDPLLRTIDADEKKLLVEARQAVDLELRLVFKDDCRRIEAESSQKISLFAGKNEIALEVPDLPGGIHIVEYFLSGPSGIYDSGAFRFDTPESYLLAVEFASAGRCFPSGTNPEFTVTLDKPADLEMEIEDSDGRIVAQEERRNVLKATFRIVLKAPFTLLYRVVLRVKEGGRVVARKEREFSVPDQALDPTDISAALWFIGKEFTPLIRNLGFDHIAVSWGHDAHGIGFMRSFANSNLRPLPIGIGTVYGGNAHLYRSDKASDPVRDPCYSDPVLHQMAEEKIREQFDKQFYQYYDARNFFLGDEDFLGSTVCYSEHCLGDFRKYLRKRYRSLEELNASWESSFATWDEVVPKQLNELKDNVILAPWLEHRMFMSEVFADRWLGDTATYVKKIFPGAKLGLSGSQIPGFSYNWEALMKHIDFIAYYGGLQNRLIHDFGSEGLRSGQWSGGYVSLTAPAEGYEKGMIWQDLFRGANMLPCWHGTMFNGDVTPTENMLYYSEALKELKAGAGKMFLSGKKPLPQVGLLHSQASLFAAMTGFGEADWQNAQSSWDALLTDLNLPFRFVPGYELENSVPEEKLFILPAAVVLSDAQLSNLRRFIEGGGVLLADFAPGCRDGHGNIRQSEALTNLFGVRTGEPNLRSGTVKLAPRPEFAIPEISGEFQVADAEIPVPAVKAIGKGRAILLNFAVNGYRQLSIGGVGGETDTTVDGSEKFCFALRQLLSSVAAGAGVKSLVKVTGTGGETFSGLGSWRGGEGGNYIFGFIRFERVPRIDPERFDEVTVEFPLTGHIYDVREKRYLGFTNRIQTRIIRGDARLFAILKDKISEVSMVLPETVKLGENLILEFSAGSGSQVFRLELCDPSGVLHPGYSSVIAVPAGKGTAKFQIAFNHPPGSWKAVAVHIASGLRCEKRVNVLKNY